MSNESSEKELVQTKTEKTWKHKDPYNLAHVRDTIERSKEPYALKASCEALQALLHQQVNTYARIPAESNYESLYPDPKTLSRVIETDVKIFDAMADLQKKVAAIVEEAAHAINEIEIAKIKDETARLRRASERRSVIDWYKRRR